MEFVKQIDGPVAVVGDLHGQIEKLRRVIEQLQHRSDYQERWLVFIGDLCDRGPDTRGVLDFMVKLFEAHPRTAIVSGNHELAMAGALGLTAAPQNNNWPHRWLDHYGSEQTFESYGVPFGELDALRETLPDSHRAFISNLPWGVDHPEYYFVHAGLDPLLGMATQKRILDAPDYSLRRPDWLCSKKWTFLSPPEDCSQIVVSGHAHVDQVTFARKRLLIDTTGGFTGSLSCVLLPEQEVLHSDPQAARQPVYADDTRIEDLIRHR